MEDTITKTTIQTAATLNEGVDMASETQEAVRTDHAPITNTNPTTDPLAMFKREEDPRGGVMKATVSLSNADMILQWR